MDVLASSPSNPLLPYQAELQPFVTTVIGNLAYDRFRRQLESNDHILLHHGIEERFLRVALDQELAKRRAEAEQTGKLRVLCPGDQVLFQKVSAQALRCCLLRTLTGESYRGFAQTLAELDRDRQWLAEQFRRGP